MTALTITAYGIPVTQGSIRSLGAGRPSVHSNAARLKPWRMVVQDAALDVMLFHDRIEGPAAIRLVFSFDRPLGHYRTTLAGHSLRDGSPPFPITRTTGDTDKLVRACFDALEAAGVVRDDAQFHTVRARKVWTGEHEDALNIPGVRITVEAVAA